jgi:hypothetical protein
VHRPDEVVHLLDGLGGWLDHEVDALAQRVQVEVGDDAGDLDQRIEGIVQPRHLAVDPDEAVVHKARPYRGT